MGQLAVQVLTAVLLLAVVGVGLQQSGGVSYILQPLVWSMAGMGTDLRGDASLLVASCSRQPCLQASAHQAMTSTTSLSWARVLGWHHSQAAGPALRNEVVTRERVRCEIGMKPPGWSRV